MNKPTRWSILAVLPILAACRESPTGNADSIDPLFKPAPAGPGYAVVVPPVTPGYAAFMPTDINAHHVAIGVMNPAGTTGPSFRQGAYWKADAGGPPQLLPLGSHAGPGIPTDIADDGVIGGNIGRAAVLWRPVGAVWELVTLHADARVNGVGTGGRAVGALYNPAYVWQENPQPVLWDADGAAQTLPLPSSGEFNGGEAHAISSGGDIAGEVQVWTLGVWYSWGAVWIRREDGSYGEPIVFQGGPSRGISERAAAGALFVTAGGANSYRHLMVRDASGSWAKGDSSSIAGTAEDMNGAGDLTGTDRRSRYQSAGTPFVAMTSGAVISLPLPKSSTGVATGLSTDGWVAGRIELTGVIWKR